MAKSKFYRELLLGLASVLVGVGSSMYIHAPELISVFVQIQGLQTHALLASRAGPPEQVPLAVLDAPTEVESVSPNELQPTVSSQEILAEQRADQVTTVDEPSADEDVWRDADPVWAKDDALSDTGESLALDEMDEAETDEPHLHDEFWDEPNL